MSDGQIYTAERILSLIADELKIKPFRIKVPGSVISTLASVGTIAGKVLNKSYALNRDKLNEIKQDYWICSAQKSYEHFKFKPKYTMESGIPQTVAWYKVNGWL